MSDISDRGKNFIIPVEKRKRLPQNILLKAAMAEKSEVENEIIVIKQRIHRLVNIQLPREENLLEEKEYELQKKLEGIERLKHPINVEGEVVEDSK